MLSETNKKKVAEYHLKQAWKITTFMDPYRCKHCFENVQKNVKFRSVAPSGEWGSHDTQWASARRPLSLKQSEASKTKDPKFNRAGGRHAAFLCTWYFSPSIKKYFINKIEYEEQKLCEHLRKIYERHMEPFTTNILASKTPSTIKEWGIKRGQVFTRGEKKEQRQRHPLGTSVHLELSSLSEMQQQLQGSRGLRSKNRINTSHKTDWPTQLIKPWHSKTKNGQAGLDRRSNIF